MAIAPYILALPHLIYVIELTYLLFLKMAKETRTENLLPEGYRWDDLESKAALDRLEFYKLLLIHLGSRGSTLVKEIFANANSSMKLAYLAAWPPFPRALKLSISETSSSGLV